MDIKDIKTVDDLRKACPDMVAKIEAEAINAERTRIPIDPTSRASSYQERAARW